MRRDSQLQAGIGRPGDVTLVPYHKMAHQHHNLYWMVQSA